MGRPIYPADMTIRYYITYVNVRFMISTKENEWKTPDAPQGSTLPHVFCGRKCAFCAQEVQQPLPTPNVFNKS